MSDYSYVATCPVCHRIVALTIDCERDMKDVAKDVAGFLRDGLTVDRIETEVARRQTWGHTKGCLKARTRRSHESKEG